MNPRTCAYDQSDTRSRKGVRRRAARRPGGRPKGGPWSLEDIDLIDGRNFVAGVPYEWFRQLRAEAPVYWHPEAASPRGGFWAVTGYDDCVTVNRDWEHFSSARHSALFADMDDERWPSSS